MDTEQMRQLMEDQLALSARLRGRIRDLEQAVRAPVAVVGMGLRLPRDLSSPEQYWDFLRSEDSVISEIPPERPGLRAAYHPTVGTPGRSYVNRASFLADISHFDADFFGISQREAELLDPQQRLLLETAWEALERAGIAVRRADRLNVGVYLGMMASEYAERLAVQPDKSPIDPYYATGGGLCFGAGRISYVMGFSGPVVSVDTACSSSLAALHLAVRALRGGECRYALVCGSNLLLSANLMISLAQSRALAPDGRSKSFLASADGYGRGEGVGVLVLMRQDDAEREERPILAVVRGTAINHDGAASGLTVPNGPAQTDVIRAAYADAGVEASDIGYVEAHGTGTLLGDPVEVGALDGALGEAVRERGTPLAVGSVKARLGHLEAASGIAGLMKAVLMLHHGQIPPTVSAADGQLNPHIEWDRLRFSVPRRTEPWPAALPRRVAGVNSFGMSGTNVHVVLEAYQGAADPAAGATAEPGVAGARPELLTLSAKHPAALADLAKAVGDYLKEADGQLVSSVCHTLRAGRAPFAHRLAVTGAGAAVLAERLGAALDRAAARPGPAAGIRDLTLWVVPDPQPLAEAARELVAAYPRLAGTGPAPTRDPAKRLAGLLSRFGPKVRLRRGVARDGALARLEWQVDGVRGRRRVPLLAAAPGGPGIVEALLGALAELYLAGAELSFDALGAPGARLLGDLPSYPFRRRRFWIDEPGPLHPGGDGVGADSGMAAPPPDDRDALTAYLLAELALVLRATDTLDPTRSFLDTGGDSFISTQYMSKIEKQYPVDLTPDELLSDQPLSVLIGLIADRIVERSAEEPESVR